MVKGVLRYALYRLGDVVESPSRWGYYMEKHVGVYEPFLRLTLQKVIHSMVMASRYRLLAWAETLVLDEGPEAKTLVLEIQTSLSQTDSSVCSPQFLVGDVVVIDGPDHHS